MSGQMSLLAPPSTDVLEVPVSREVLHYGADAHVGRGRGVPLFAHRHVPPGVAKIPDEGEWMAALDFAEQARRGNQSGVAKLDLSQRGGAGSNGLLGSAGPGRVSLSASGKGVHVGSWLGDKLATWPQLLAARAEQREVEPEVARARDLAQAYSYLHFYGGVYDEPQEGDKWSPIPLMRRLAAEARDLGGDPTLLEPQTEYMREALSS